MQDRKRDAERLRRRCGGHPEERRVDCLALRFGQVGHRDLEERAKEVAQCREGEARLDLGGSSRHDAIAAFRGGIDARVPERGLADPRLAREEHHPRNAAAGHVEEPLDLGELAFSTEDRGRSPGRAENGFVHLGGSLQQARLLSISRGGSVSRPRARAAEMPS